MSFVFYLLLLVFVSLSQLTAGGWTNMSKTRGLVLHCYWQIGGR